MATATLLPVSLTDASANVSSGGFTDVDNTIAIPSGVAVISVSDQFVSQSNGTANGAYTFGITDAPGDFDTFTSIRCQVRARITGTDDDDTFTYIVDISGTNAPTDTHSWTDIDIGAGYATEDWTNSSVTPSAANIDGWVVRVYQDQYSKTKGPDGFQIEIDEIELTLTYSPSVGGPAKAVFGHHQNRITS